MRYDKNILGFNGFIWFNGVVEDRNDPQYLDECEYVVSVFIRKTRQYYYEDLPGRRLFCRLHQPAISGLGQSPSFLVEGTWVFGYFRDGDDCQEPMV